ARHAERTSSERVMARRGAKARGDAAAGGSMVWQVLTRRPSAATSGDQAAAVRFVQPLIRRTRGEQLRVRADAGQVVRFQDDDAVDRLQRVYLVGDDERRAADHEIAHRAVEQRLGLRVGGAGELVEVQDAWVAA